MSSVDEPFSPELEFQAARRVVIQRKSPGRCWQCTGGWCWLADWARDYVDRREATRASSSRP